MALIDLVGKKFGRLEVMYRSDKKAKDAYWVCFCKCGGKIHANSQQLRTGRTVSCGCKRRERMKKGMNYQHGQSESLRWWLWMRAKRRAKEKDIEFSIKLSDIPNIPKKCPILNIKLFPARGEIGSGGHGRKGSKNNSPALDRIIPEKGYTVGNIQIISQRANQIKSDATVEEIRKIYRHMIQVEE